MGMPFRVTGLFDLGFDDSYTGRLSDPYRLLRIGGVPADPVNHGIRPLYDPLLIRLFRCVFFLHVVESLQSQQFTPLTQACDLI